MTVIRKAFQVQVEELGPRSIRIICSTDSIDRTGEVINQDGIDLSQYKSNPIVLWSHNPEHPIANAPQAELIGDKLTATVDFFPEGISQKADEICQLYKLGLVKTVSIGFDPTDMEPMNPARPKGPQRYLKCTLLEISLVTIPANPEAVVVQRALSTAEAPPQPQEVRLTNKTKTAPVAGRKMRTKGLYGVSQLAYLLAELAWIQDSARCEAAAEGDGSAVPGMLLEIARQTGAALVAMTEEEVGELIASLGSDEVDDLDEDEAAIVATSTAPIVRKALFRGKHAAAVRKSGKKISGATATALNGAVDLHEKAMDAHRDAMALHTKAIAAVNDILDDADVAVVQTSSTTSESEGSTNGKTAPVEITKERRLKDLDLLRLRAA